MLEHLKKQNNLTTTENGAVSLKTTKSDLLDFFAEAGSMRNSSDVEIINSFTLAFKEDPKYAMKSLFYFRDIRGGQGERRLFKVILKHLGENHAEALSPNIHLIPKYGRWDDVLELFDTKLESDVLQLIKNQWFVDLEQAAIGKNVSLLFKWLPSINTSSNETKEKAKKIAKYLKLSPKQYRKSLSLMREILDVLERKMCAKEWSDIDYTQVPSQASLKFRGAFYRNDEERYTTYLEELENGKVKVNASTLYPHQIVGKVDVYNSDRNPQGETLLNEMWKNLPDYVGEDNSNSLAVIDVSGSMSGTPMEVAVSLGMYVAEKNKGKFQNHFITFSERPEIVEIKGETFCDKVRNIKRASWGYNTNLEKVFSLILNTAVKNELPQSEIPSKLFIISDMHIDAADRRGTNETFYETMKRKYKEKGYILPKIVFWNVDARPGSLPVEKDTEDVQLVSGFSPSLFEALLNNEDLNPYGLMMKILDSERYQDVSI